MAVRLLVLLPLAVAARESAKDRLDRFYDRMSPAECGVNVGCLARHGDLAKVQALLPGNLFHCDSLDEAAAFAHNDIVEYLLKNAKGCQTADPLEEAASDNQVQTMEALLDFNGTTDYQSSCGFTPLTGAAQNGHMRAVEVLLEHKAAPEFQDRYNFTALMWAAKNGHQKVFQFLLQHGATLKNPWAVDPRTNLPIWAQIEDKGMREWWESRMTVSRLLRKVSMSRETYYALIAGVLLALVLVVVQHWLEGVRMCSSYPETSSLGPGTLTSLTLKEEHLQETHVCGEGLCEDQEPFRAGAYLLAARAAMPAVKGLALRLLRIAEAFANVVAVFGYGMVRVGWPYWLPAVVLSFLLPAMYHLPFAVLLRQPALVIAAHSPVTALVALVRIMVLGGLVWFQDDTSPALKQINARLKSDWAEQMLLEENPIEGLPLPHVTMRDLIQKSAPLAAIFVVAYVLALLIYLATQQQQAAAVEDFIKKIEDKVPQLLNFHPEETAEEEKGGWPEDVKPEVACRCSMSCLNVKIFLYLLDIVLDFVTVVSLLASDNFIFAFVLTAIIFRTFFQELCYGSPCSICESFRRSTERGIMHKVLLKVLNEEKSFEGVLSLALTSYSYYFCILSPLQGVSQALSIALSAYGVGEIVYEQIDLNLMKLSTLRDIQEDTDPEESETSMWGHESEQ